MKSPGFLKKLQLLNLDTVIGALACGIMAVKVTGINPGPAWWIILALSVWLVYTTDRLIDGFKTGKRPQSLRHGFHYRNRRSLFIVICFISIICGFITFIFLDVRIIYFGLFLGFSICLYLLLVYKIGHKNNRFFNKEIFIATIYSIGIWGGPVVLSNFNLNIQQWFLFLALFLQTLLNLLTLSYQEVQSDTRDGHTSFARTFGMATTSRSIYLISLLILFLCLFIIFTSNNIIFISAASIFILMGFLQITIMLNTQRLHKNLLYRSLGELIFWLPGIMYFL